MNEMFDRTIKLIGIEKFDKIARSNVLVVGVGGVGGFLCEILVRSGVCNITVVDDDIVDISNINRQIIATVKTIGKPKVEALKERLLEINPQINCNAMQLRYNNDNCDKIFTEKFDYVADCIDSVNDKASLIKYCFDNKINIISAVGSANRYDLPLFEVKDIFDTNYDGLARALRKKLRDLSVIKLNCVCAKGQPNDIKGTPASIAYYPSASSCVMAAKLLNDLIEV